MGQYDCVCEKPMMGSVPAPQATREPGTPPILGVQLARVTEAMLCAVEHADAIRRFTCDRAVPIDKREGESVTDYLAWYFRTLQSLIDGLRDIGEVIR